MSEFDRLRTRVCCHKVAASYGAGAGSAFSISESPVGYTTQRHWLYSVADERENRCKGKRSFSKETLCSRGFVSYERIARTTNSSVLPHEPEIFAS